MHTLLCRGSGLPIFFLLSPANGHDAPFAQPLLAWALRLYQIRPRVIRLDAAYWGLRLIAWIHSVVGAIAVIPWKRHPAKESFLPASYLDQRRMRQAQQHRTLFRARLPFLSSSTSTPLQLVCYRLAGRIDLHRFHHRRFGCPAGRPP